jgi:hypothetical protein
MSRRTSEDRQQEKIRAPPTTGFLQRHIAAAALIAELSTLSAVFLFMIAATSANLPRPSSDRLARHARAAGSHGPAAPTDKARQASRRKICTRPPRGKSNLPDPRLQTAGPAILLIMG